MPRIAAASSKVGKRAITRMMCSRSISSKEKFPPYLRRIGGFNPRGNMRWKGFRLDDLGGPKDHGPFDGVASSRMFPGQS